MPQSIPIFLASGRLLTHSLFPTQNQFQMRSFEFALGEVANSRAKVNRDSLCQPFKTVKRMKTSFLWVVVKTGRTMQARQALHHQDRRVEHL